MAHRTVASIVLSWLLLTGPAAAQDTIDLLMQRSPGNDPSHHAHSDFTDPLGRFLDFLAEGAFVDARNLQPAACAAWRTSPQSAALSGKFRVWETEVDLNTLCGQR